MSRYILLGIACLAGFPLIILAYVVMDVMGWINERS